MRDAIVLDSVLQSFRDVRLSDEVREGLRTPFARDHLVGHTSCIFDGGMEKVKGANQSLEVGDLRLEEVA